jgi:multiple sugar transport system substrate-binding protein
MRGVRLLALVMLAALIAACGASGGGAPTQATSAPSAGQGAAPTAASAAEQTSAPAPTAALAATTEAPAATAEATAGAAQPSGEAITLNVICRCVAGGVSANQVRFMTEFVAPKFKEMMAAQGKNVTVNLIQFGGSDEQMKQQFALDLKVGQGADVMGFDGFWVPEFVSGGLLKPLNEVAGADVDKWEGWQHIPKNVQALLTYQGKVYGVPSGTDARAIWYRKDLLQKAGLPAEWQPKSWDELLDAARKIKQAMPDVTPLQINAGTAMGEATTLQGWYMVVQGSGANVYDFDTNKYVVKGQPLLDALNFYKTVYVDEKLGDARLQLLKDGRQQSFLNFRDGKIAMLVEGDFFWRSVLASGDTKLENRDQLVSFAKMPAMQPGKGLRGQDFVTASGGGGNVLNPNTKHPAEAWALLAFMNSKEALDWLQGIEPRIRARDDVPVPNDPVMTKLAQELLPITTIRPSDPNYPKVSEAIQLMTEQVVSEASSPEDALSTYADTVTSLVGADKVEEAK